MYIYVRSKIYETRKDKTIMQIDGAVFYIYKYISSFTENDVDGEKAQIIWNGVFFKVY